MEGVEGGKASERYDTFDAVRNLFGGAHKSSENETLASRHKERRKSRSDPRSMVKAPVPLADDKSEDTQATERISQAKELAVILETKKIAEEARLRELKQRSGERPSSASTSGKRPTHQHSELYSLLMVKANSISSLTSDRGYGTSSPKPSNGSMSPRGGSETNLLDDSLGSEMINEVMAKDPPLMAWHDANSDRKVPQKFVRSKHLVSNDDVFHDESPQLRQLRETVEALEAKSSNPDLVCPGYCLQTTSAGRVTGEVRVPVSDSKYKEFASGDELEDDSTWEQNFQKFTPGKFVPQPEPKPEVSAPTDQTVSKSVADPKKTPPHADSGSDDCYTPDLPRSKASVRRTQSASALTLHQYMMKLQARKQKLSQDGIPVETDGEDSPQIPRETDVLRKSMQWDDTIGEWVFEGKKKPYSPQMASKHEKRRSRQIHIPAPDSAYEPFLNKEESNWEPGLAKVTLGKFVVQDSPNTSCDTVPGNDSIDGQEETADSKEVSHSETQAATPSTTAKEENTPCVPEQPANDVSREKAVSDPTTQEDDEEELAIAKKIEERAKLFGGVKLRRAKSFSAKHSVTRALARKKATTKDDSQVTSTRRGSDVPPQQTDIGTSEQVKPINSDTTTSSTGKRTSSIGKFSQTISIKIASLRK